MVLLMLPNKLLNKVMVLNGIFRRANLTSRATGRDAAVTRHAELGVAASRCAGELYR